MEKFVIRGGNALSGDVVIGGAKNAAVAILPATILAADKCLIENLPCISDVMASLQILSELGASIRMISKNTDEMWLEHIALKEAVSHLSEREQKILAMRFYQSKTQMEVSEEIGISQAQVSRLEKHALRQIRKEL